ncbi:hypothetical protein D3C72_1870790 [compost metagenome]
MYRLRDPPSIQPMATSLAGEALILASSSSPMAPSITARIWSWLRNTKGMLNTFTSGTTVPTGPSEVRRMLMAPNCVCSIISFSPPSTPPGKVWIFRRPLVAASSFLPMFSTATTLG